MNHRIVLIAAAGTAMLASVRPVSAQEPAAGSDRAVQFDVGTGLEYDSNVAVLELDATADAGDVAALLNFGVAYDRPDHGKLDLQAGYNFSDTLHDDFDEFDVRIHRGSGTLSYDLGRTDVGSNLQYARAELDGNEFLALAQVSPYVSRLVGKRLFLRFAYAYTDKDFAGNPDRNATTDGAAADAYVFLNGLTTYLVFGYRFDSEDAVDGQFDYAAHKLNAQLSRRLKAGSRELTFKTYLRFETRDYDNTTLSIGAPRKDDRAQFEASLDVPMTRRVLATIGYKHADNQSNLPSVDFAENVWSASFKATF
jgi:hypothetical protein